MLRILLYLGVNMAIMLVLSVALKVLGVDQWMMRQGMSGEFYNLLVYALVFGFAGSFISLFLSKWMAKRATGAYVIENPQGPEERWLVETVRRLAMKSNIGMPEVAIYDAQDINAFATGATRNSSMVAVSTGLLRSMNQDEAEAVLAHEISHIANGDMVTLALVQGVMNTFVIVISNVLGRIIDRALSRDGESSGHGFGFYAIRMVCELVLGILASMIVAWFSRFREYRADSGSAALVGKQKMIAALERLQEAHMPSQLPDQVEAFGINSRGTNGFLQLFASHPPLEERIAALRNL